MRASVCLRLLCGAVIEDTSRRIFDIWPKDAARTAQGVVTSADCYGVPEMVPRFKSLN